MSAREIAIIVLLVIGVGVCLWSCLGLFVLRNDWGRLHALGPASTVGVLSLCLAVILKEGASLSGAVKPVLLVVFYWVAAPLMTHAIARALYFFQAEKFGTPPERRRG